jgi:hypothetical protein
MGSKPDKRTGTALKADRTVEGMGSMPSAFRQIPSPSAINSKEEWLEYVKSLCTYATGSHPLVNKEPCFVCGKNREGYLTAGYDATFLRAVQKVLQSTTTKGLCTYECVAEFIMEHQNEILNEIV